MSANRESSRLWVDVRVWWSKAKNQDSVLGYLLVLPALILVFIIFFYPTIFNLYIATHEWSWSTPLDAPKPYIGIQNITNILRTPRFYNSLKVSLSLVVFAIAAEYLLGLALALLLNQKFLGRGVFRAVFILPMMIAPIVIGIQWRYLLSGNFGVINYLIIQLGTEPPLWLSNPRWGIPVLVAVDTWTYLPFVALILLAGLQQIPLDLYDAAKVDGAGAVARFRYITMPFLKPATILVLLIRGTDAFRAFDVVYVLTGGGPDRSTEVLGILLYHVAWRRQPRKGGGIRIDNYRHRHAHRDCIIKSDPN